MRILRTLRRHVGARWRRRRARPKDRRDDPASDSAGGRPAGEPPDGSTSPDRGERSDHLRDVPDGAGCTEIWRHLSENGHADGEADD